MNAATEDNLLITVLCVAMQHDLKKQWLLITKFQNRVKFVAIGLYGDTLDVSFAINGGWTPFGPERIVTKSEANVLYELDQSASIRFI